MMKLYYAPATCSLVVRIILNELNLPFDSFEVDLKTKRLENHEDFREINPKGAVPTLVLDNDEVLTENAVILQYLADTFGTDLLPRVGDFQRYRVLEWLNFITTELHKGFGLLFNPNIPGEVKETVLKPLLKTKFNLINDDLRERPYLCGLQLTLPDAYLYVMMRWAATYHIDLASLTHLKAYRTSLEQRVAVKRSLLQEHLSEIA